MQEDGPRPGLAGVLRRLGPFDLFLVLLFVPIWLVIMVHHIDAGLDGRRFDPPAFWSSAPGPDGYPTVLRVFEGDSELAVGDRLVRIGGTDLRGSAWFEVYERLPREFAEDPRATAVVERAGERIELDFAFAHSPSWWLFTPAGIAWMVLGTLGFLLSSDRHNAKVRFGCAFLGGTALTGMIEAFGPFHRSEFLARSLGEAFLVAFLLWLVWSAPDSSRSWRRRGLATCAAFATFAFVARAGASFGLLLDGGSGWIVPAGLVAYLAVFGWALSRRIRGADPARRRQGRWYGFGLYLALGAVVGALVLSGFVGGAWNDALWVFAGLGQLAGACCVAVAMFGYGYNDLDIDRLISATASYNIAGVLLIAAGLWLAPRAGEALGTFAGTGTAAGQAVLALGLAALVIPIHRRVRPRIEQIFFPERVAVQEGFDRLLASLSEVGQAGDLVRLAGEQLDALLRPERCVAYGRAGDGFEPLFVRGSAIPPFLPATSPFVSTLADRTRPLVAAASLGRSHSEMLTPFDRAALDTLAAAVVMPVRRGVELAAIFCLGRKRSGDVYTATDLALLHAVADKVSSRLDRFSAEELVRESREMQRELRRYVPGAVESGLEAEDLGARERTVSVMFVDMRGYTAYAEGRRAADVFSTVNRYTREVSSLVAKFGGHVVEFGGDGLMAVFGAPRSLIEKERAAVESARAIVESVSRMDPVEDRLSVGVGVATGATFVGSIEAADRLIWTALGTTVNLAARLQSLTRELGAAIAVDVATWRAAGEGASDFERRDQLPIRGLSHREDVYILPHHTDR